VVPERLRQIVPVAIGLVLFFVALDVLRVELRAVTLQELAADIFNMPRSHLATAVGLTALSYFVLTGYDQLAFAYAGKRLPRLRIIFVSALAYAVSNNIGFAGLSGASVRYRFYTRWGVTAEELSRIIFGYSVAFGLGLCGMGGVSLLMSPLLDLPELPTRAVLTPVAIVLLLIPIGYVTATIVRRQPVRLWRIELRCPRRVSRSDSFSFPSRIGWWRPACCTR